MKITDFEIGKKYKDLFWLDSYVMFDKGPLGNYLLMCFSSGKSPEPFHITARCLHNDWIEIKEKKNPCDIDSNLLIAQLKKAQDKIAELQKENDSLKYHLTLCTAGKNWSSLNVMLLKSQVDEKNEEIKKAVDLLKDASYQMINYYSKRPAHDGFYDIGIKIKNFLNNLEANNACK